MLMPIVSMNKMAMNESVATTCCYREIAMPDKVMWEVLNGGWIGTGYVIQDGFSEAFDFVKDSTWYNYGYDMTNEGDSAALATTMKAAYPTLTTSEDGVSVWMLKDKTLESLTIATDGMRRGAVCNHSDGNCAYRFSANVMVDNHHFESKMKHDTAGDDWTLPHEAMKFSS